MKICKIKIKETEAINFLYSYAQSRLQIAFVFRKNILKCSTSVQIV